MVQFRWSIAALSAHATAVASVGIPVSFSAASGTPKGHDYSELAKQLSSTASIYLPGSEEFNDITLRWSNLSAPIASIVVVPGTEDDVVFANEHSVPFLATNGFHGSITTLGQMSHGIEIFLSQLKKVEISDDGSTATIGGGIRAKDLIDTLWDAGKQTVTGACECVGYLGPGLGGGHGWLQGHHGLISDQYLSFNVVVANGSLVTIDETSDLFWGMKGAGHNFGIVTSVTSKIYDLEFPNYAIDTIFFSGDKVEEVYQLWNELSITNGTAPVGLNVWDYWYFDPTIDPEKPVIVKYIVQEGVDVVDPIHTEPFHQLGPIKSEPRSGTYRDLAAWTGISLADGPCQKTGNANPRFPIYLKEYNPQAQREVYELFREATTGPNAHFANSLFMFEGYSQQGVKAFADDASAFAYRSDNLLVAPLLIYPRARR
ncbi:FAD-linked oxidoreductase [Apiospora saccharicola]|uniref:FAD-linked oxidoreductase n=1 Tax=Apiospora saccharicola TaxID=335842 RepID=A0ABR1VKX9_9PEZI